VCEHIQFPGGGGTVIICGVKPVKYCACGHGAAFLCDWKVPGRKSGTCDAPICTRHAKQVAPGKHLCPLHQHQWDDWQRKHPSTTVVQQKTLFEEEVS
jgi:hypothetical protein